MSGPGIGTRAEASAHLDADAVRRTLKEAGLRARHSLSQNFLADVDVLDAILAEAAPTTGRRVLEIGPGLGILTGGLLAAGATVTTIELDRALAARLRSAFAEPIALAEGEVAAAGGLRLIEGDALDQQLTMLLPAPYDVVANLPYHVTSPILHRLLEAPPRPARSSNAPSATAARPTTRPRATAGSRRTARRAIRVAL